MKKPFVRNSRKWEFISTDLCERLLPHLQPLAEQDETGAGTNSAKGPVMDKTKLRNRSWNRALLFWLAALLISLIMEPRSLAESSQAPKMVLKERLFDFKLVYEGQIVTHDFPVFNQGTDTLKIERVKTTCSCSVVSFDSAIPPGGQGNIAVKVYTHGSDGRERRGVTIFTNDPNWKEAVLDLRADVRPAIVVSESAVQFSGKSQVSSTKVVEIKSGIDRPLVIQPDEFDLVGKVDYAVEETQKGQSFRVTFRNRPGPFDFYRGSLTFKTNFPEKPELTIWIFGRFKN